VRRIGTRCSATPVTSFPRDLAARVHLVHLQGPHARRPRSSSSSCSSSGKLALASSLGLPSILCWYCVVFCVLVSRATDAARVAGCKCVWRCVLLDLLLPSLAAAMCSLLPYLVMCETENSLWEARIEEKAMGQWDEFHFSVFNLRSNGGYAVCIVANIFSEDSKSKRARLVGCLPRIIPPHTFKHICVDLKMCPLEVPFEIQCMVLSFMYWPYSW
jgi:hypothetical protein